MAPVPTPSSEIVCTGPLVVFSSGGLICVLFLIRAIATTTGLAACATRHRSRIASTGVFSRGMAPIRLAIVSCGRNRRHDAEEDVNGHPELPLLQRRV